MIGRHLVIKTSTHAYTPPCLKIINGVVVIGSSRQQGVRQKIRGVVFSKGPRVQISPVTSNEH